MYLNNANGKKIFYRKIIELVAWATAAIFLVAFFVYIYSDTIRFVSLYAKAEGEEGESKSFIKWAEFNIPYAALEKALNADVNSYAKETHINWIETLALLSTKYGGNWKRYKAKDLDAIIAAKKEGDPFEKLKASKYYSYFFEVYDTILCGFLGDYKIELFDEQAPDQRRIVQKYGLKVFSPIGEGFGFSHYDDFGAGRNYGYKRRHLGHDIMGSIGTPIIAVEGGIVEEAGWNRYGGWRIGIRSYDKKRYYYYAHLRKDSPFHNDIKKGGEVGAGDVIGYLGMTGYSDTQNVNNINVPHLHFGLQLIFDESQKEGATQIWIDVYQIFKLLQKNKSTVVYDKQTKDYNRKYKIIA